MWQTSVQHKTFTIVKSRIFSSNFFFFVSGFCWILEVLISSLKLKSVFDKYIYLYTYIHTYRYIYIKKIELKLAKLRKTKKKPKVDFCFRYVIFPRVTLACFIWVCVCVLCARHGWKLLFRQREREKEIEINAIVQIRFRNLHRK